MYLVAKLDSLENFGWPEKKFDKDQLSVRSILEENPKDALPISPQVTECLSTWQKFLEIFPKKEKLPSFPVWSMEFGATYPYAHRSIRKIRVSDLRNFKGVFGDDIGGRLYTEAETYLPSYARGGGDVFPRWKQNFIRQNRELFQGYGGCLTEWVPEIRRFPPSQQKFEWNCQGEERNIWKYIIQFRASGVRVKRPTTAPSLVAMTSTQTPIVGWEKRYMTVRECASLQSMSLKNWPSRTVAMRALGNAVNVNVVKEIIARLLK